MNIRIFEDSNICLIFSLLSENLAVPFKIVLDDGGAWLRVWERGLGFFGGYVLVDSAKLFEILDSVAKYSDGEVDFTRTKEMSGAEHDPKSLRIFGFVQLAEVFEGLSVDFVFLGLLCHVQILEIAYGSQLATTGD